MNRWATAMIFATLMTAGIQPVAAANVCSTASPSAPLSTGDQLVAGLGATLLGRDWAAYKARFIATDGRVIDQANGSISHSEGQGYAMLLAAYMGDRATFDRVWAWTRTRLLIRPDGLAAWKWDPALQAVADRNNATDGDILIAWALGEAAVRFAEPRFGDAGRAIAVAIGKTLVRMTAAGPVLLPGAVGFEAGGNPATLQINLSYWVFPAFPTLERLAGEIDWAGLRASGLGLLRMARFGPARLPSDWIALSGGQALPAGEGRPEFGYNAIRIPLYLIAAGVGQPGDLEPFAALAADGPVKLVDLKTGLAADVMGGNGFRLLLGLTRCICDGHPLSDVTSLPNDDLYYPATLGLLTKWVMIERYPQCL